MNLHTDLCWVAKRTLEFTARKSQKCHFIAPARAAIQYSKSTQVHASPKSCVYLRLRLASSTHKGPMKLVANDSQRVLVSAKNAQTAQKELTLN